MAEATDCPSMGAAEVARQDGRVWIIDVRPATSHRAEHVAGARSIPMAHLEARLAALPSGVPIAFYCT